MDLPELINNLMGSARGSARGPAIAEHEVRLNLQETTAAVFSLPVCRDANITGGIPSFPKVLEGLAASLSNCKRPALQTITACALANLGFSTQSMKENIFNLPGVMENLIKSIGQDQNSGLAEAAARAILALATTEDSTMQGQIISFPNLLESLITALAKGLNPALQANVASAIANLAHGNQSFKCIILNFPGLLNNLVKLINQDQISFLARAATSAIVALTSIKDSAAQTLSQIACFPNLLEGLRASLSKGEEPALQTSAAWALRNLALGNELSKKRILDVPGLMDNLLKSLKQDQTPGLAEVTAEAIAYLTRTKDPAMQHQLACFPNLLESLGALLSDGHNVVVQKHMAYALSVLPFGDESIKSKIFSVPGLLHNLVKFIEHDQVSDLEISAASTVTALSLTRNQAMQHQIAHFPNLLESLGASLSKNENPVLHMIVVTAFVNLGCSTESIKCRIFNIPGLMESLVKLMGQDQNSELAELAAGNIGVLSTIKNMTILGQITRIPNLLESLRASLSKVKNPDLQMKAALIVSNLVGGGDRSTREKIFSYPGLTDGMLKLRKQKLEQEQEQG